MTQNGKNTRKKLVTPEQCRAARGLVGWSQSQLAEQANLSKSTVAKFESGGELSTNNHIALDMALEREGVALIDSNGGGIGVRFRDPARRDKAGD
jgi:transcriptional regulator with XRE-family HTH domain